MQVQQLSGQLEALQQEAHRVTASHQDLEHQNRLLQEDCAQLQVQISAFPMPAAVITLQCCI